MEEDKKGHSFNVLNDTADFILAGLRRLPDYQDVKVVIIGGLAVKGSLRDTLVKVRFSTAPSGLIQY